MRITLDLDDELLTRAETLTGLKEKSALVHEALKMLVERENARRLAGLGGSEPYAKNLPASADQTKMTKAIRL